MFYQLIDLLGKISSQYKPSLKAKTTSKQWANFKYINMIADISYKTKFVNKYFE